MYDTFDPITNIDVVLIEEASKSFDLEIRIMESIDEYIPIDVKKKMVEACIPINIPVSIYKKHIKKEDKIICHLAEVDYFKNLPIVAFRIDDNIAFVRETLRKVMDFRKNGWLSILADYVPRKAFNLYLAYDKNWLSRILNKYVTKYKLVEEVKEIVEKYVSRSYHNLVHIFECLSLIEVIEEEDLLIDDEKELLSLAMIFHDIIYDPSSTKNEEESASFAEQLLFSKNYSQEKINMIMSIIKATDHTRWVSDHLEKLACDIDMFGFSIPFNQFSYISSLIREEYNMCTDDVYLIGRLDFLKRLKARGYVYRSDFFKKYELAALMNISTAIAEIEFLLSKE